MCRGSAYCFYVSWLIVCVTCVDEVCGIATLPDHSCGLLARLVGLRLSFAFFVVGPHRGFTRFPDAALAGSGGVVGLGWGWWGQLRGWGGWTGGGECSSGSVGGGLGEEGDAVEGGGVDGGRRGRVW